MAWMREWSWRVAILLLPWQVRWFSEGPAIGGLPWEQGRFSVYASWLPMLVTVFFAAYREPDETDRPMKRQTMAWLAGVLLVTLPACFSIHPQASWQWILQVVLLSLFGWSLARLHIPSREFFTWVLLSLVPHAVLGIWQYTTHLVVGSKWLGMSPQDPATLGVSVVQVGDRRVLRAYGGFPHPNIFGGWLAFGLAALSQIANRKSQGQAKWLLSALCSLFTIALVLTFSRSAWIAAFVGVVAISVFAWKRAWTMEEKTRLLFIPCVILVTALATAFATRDVIMVRTTGAERLEVKSLDERASAIAAGWKAFQANPVLGNGQGTALLALDRASLPAVPPHQVPMLALLEIGSLGILGLLLLAAIYLNVIGPKAIPWFLLGAPLFLLDHYLWSLWAGQALMLLILLAPLTREEK